jgi:hypothetical protein
MATLRNVDRTDLEMLFIIRKAYLGESFATSEDIAEELGMGPRNGRSGSGRVATRLSWMVRYGLLRRVEVSDGRKAWQITDGGERLMDGKLSQATVNAIESSDPGDQMLMMRRLTQRGYVHGDDTTAVALRREYEHNAAQRNGYGRH